MPLYTYYCNECSISEDKLSSFADADVPKLCKQCNKEIMTRDQNSVYKTQLNFKGRWFKSSGSY